MDKECCLGEFINESGTFIVSDPCYRTKIGCNGLLNDVLLGKWSCIGLLDKNFSELVVVHNSFKDSDFLHWEKCLFSVDVASGQAGIFDLKYYHNDEVFDDEEPENKSGDTKFYGFCCDITLSEGAGTMKYGAVSNSGCGDGTYDCFVSRNEEGKIIAVKIIFIEGYKDDDDEFSEELDIFDDDVNPDEE